MRTAFTLPVLLLLIVPLSAQATDLPPMPKGVSSFGAVVCDGYLYIYGGHMGKTHTYSKEDVQGSFHRLKLDGGTKWEELPAGPSAQGLNLATHGGKVYRVGGMQPRNATGEAEDIHSLTDCARFDPKTGKWEALPPLPAGRSSIDVVVAGDKLVVVGGWQQRGKGEKFVWHDTVAVLDLAAAKLEWKSIPQPFQRRALTAAAVGNKVYVIGGLTPEGVDPRVDVLDVATGKWNTGPALPARSDRGAFSPAATVVNGRVVVNTSEGPVYRLNEAGDGWEKVGAAATKRMVARLVPFSNDSVLLVGGVSDNANVATVEVVKLAAKGERVTGDR